MKTNLLEKGKEEQNNCGRPEEIESIIKRHLKSSKSIEDLELCAKIGEKLKQIDFLARLLYQEKLNNELFHLFYSIRGEFISFILDTNTLKFMAWILKITQNINRELSEALKIKDYLLKEVGSFVLFRDYQFDRGYIREQLMKLENFEKNLEEEFSKIKTPLEIEIFKGMRNDDNCCHISDVMYDRIVEAIPEIKEINQEDMKEYVENENNVYNQLKLF